MPRRINTIANITASLPQYTKDELLVNASGAGKIKVVRNLLRGGANPGFRNNWAIREAVRCDRTQVVEVLIDAGAEFRFNRDELLCSAAIAGHEATLSVIAKRILRKHKAPSQS